MRLALLLCATTLALTVRAGVTVAFVEPDRFTDLGRYPLEREHAQKHLKEHLDKLGEGLPKGTELDIQILDVDLAGEEHLAGGGAKNLRIQRGGADWPAIKLRYTVERDGRKVEPREVRLLDMSYQQRLPRAQPNETFPHEKRLLTEWFDSLGLTPQGK
jgi:hypothetical protein